MNVRGRLGWALQQAADRVDHRTRITLDYPTTSVATPRYGWAQPMQDELVRYLDGYQQDYAATLTSLGAHVGDLARIPVDEASGEPLFWRNPFCSGLDGVAIYGFIRTHRPSTYLEVGSGYSTLFADRARRDGGLDTRLVSIDPAPRADVDARCDQVVRKPLEQLAVSDLPQLSAGDIFFFDGSHRAFPGSDVVVFFLEILPNLPAGVLLGIDDVMLPYDYPPTWLDRYYSEQYLLAAYLLGGARGLRPLLPNYYLSKLPPSPELAAIWATPPLDRVHPEGTTMWFVTEPR